MDKRAILFISIHCYIILVQIGHTETASTTPTTTTTTSDAPTTTDDSTTGGSVTTDVSSTSQASTSTTQDTVSPENMTDPTMAPSNTSNTTSNMTETTVSTTTSSPVITVAPIVCLNGSCTGNDTCLTGITTTCVLASGDHCYQMTSSNSSTNLVHFEVGCKSDCDPLKEDATTSNVTTTRQTTCCDTSKCNNVTLEYPQSRAAGSRQQILLLVLAIFGVITLRKFEF